MVASSRYVSPIMCYPVSVRLISCITACWKIRGSRAQFRHVLAVLLDVECLPCCRSGCDQPSYIRCIELTILDWNSAILILRYWVPEEKFPSYAWAIIFWAVFSVITLLGVNIYGELEYYFGMFKFMSLIILFILSIVANVGGFGGDYVGFRYWTKPVGSWKIS